MRLVSSFPCVDSSNKSELCFLSNVTHDKRLRCQPDGELTMDDNWKGWEVFRFIDTNDGYGSVVISSWTHKNKVLCSRPDGTVYTTENKSGDWERWTVSKTSDRGLVIRSVSHNRFLRANSSTIKTVKGGIQDGCIWSLEPANTNHFYVTSISTEQRISCNGEGHLFTTNNRLFWEEWIIEPTTPLGHVLFKSLAHDEVNARYLAASADGSLAMINQEERWKAFQTTDGSYVFVTAFDEYLACNETRGVHWSRTHSEDSSWKLEAIMPGVGKTNMKRPFADWRQW